MNLTVNGVASSAIGSSLILISIIATIGNVLLLVVMSTVRRSVPETLLLILSSLDLVFCVVILPISGVAYLTEWNIIDTPSVCDFQGLLSFFIKFTSTFIISLICLERFYYFKPYSGTFLDKSWNTRIIMLCVLCAMFSLLLGAVTLIAGNRIKHFEDSRNYCRHFEITPNDSFSTTFSIVVLILVYIMLQISMFCLFSVLCNWNAYRTHHDKFSRTTFGNEVEFIGDIVQTMGTKRTALDLDRCLSFTKMILSLCVIHWCCHLPFMVLIAVTLISGSVSPTAEFITVYISVIQPVLNPVIVFALYPPYYHNIRAKLPIKSNEMHVFNHSSDEESRYRDVSVYGSYRPKRNQAESVTYPVKESLSDNDVTIMDSLQTSSTERNGLDDDVMGLFNDGYYDSDTLTCSTCSRSDVSSDYTEDSDTDFSDGGHREIIYLNKRSRKVPLTRMHSLSHNSDRIYGRNITSNEHEIIQADNCISHDDVFIQQRDREPEQTKVDEYLPNDMIIACTTDDVDCKARRRKESILSHNGSKMSKSQIIGRRELRRLGIKRGRVTETFSRDSIPRETSLFKTSRRQNVCLVCQGSYARHVPHSKHNVYKTEDTIQSQTDPKHNCKNEKHTDSQFMNVLFQKALYWHTQVTDTQLNSTLNKSDQHNASEKSRQSPQHVDTSTGRRHSHNEHVGTSTGRRHSHDDIQYRQYIRFIASLNRQPVTVDNYHAPRCNRKASLSNVSRQKNIRKKNNKILQGETEKEEKKQIGNGMTQKSPTTNKYSLNHHQDSNRSEESTDEQFKIKIYSDNKLVSSDIVASKPLFTINKVKDMYSGVLTGPQESLNSNRTNIPKIEVTDLSTYESCNEVEEENFEDFLCKLRDAKTKLSPRKLKE